MDDNHNNEGERVVAEAEDENPVGIVPSEEEHPAAAAAAEEEQVKDEDKERDVDQTVKIPPGEDHPPQVAEPANPAVGEDVDGRLPVDRIDGLSNSAGIAVGLVVDGGEMAEAVNIEGTEEKIIKEETLDRESVNWMEGNDSGTEEEQAGFMKELERFHREKSLDFKPPKFYGEGLNCLKLWRAVTRLGGYERALLEYEKDKIRCGELHVPPAASLTEMVAIDNHVGGNQAPGSGRARRDAAARAMQGWHSQRHLNNGEVGHPIIKDKSLISLSKREKQLKNLGLKRKKPSSLDRNVKSVRPKFAKPQLRSLTYIQSDTMVIDIGARADWVKISVQRTKDCFEIYVLVPGLLREEVHVQSDPAGRLVISGEPEHLDNPWGVTPFKKLISLPLRIDPHQTSAVVTLHGQLFVRAPFEQSCM
ncbi:AT-rich interactive domain-containing protein 3 [Acorus gramineus]|uniref:AT-rich interactive domain-containing protein 3 n=1 Tax=Acorus gramineus TaxID=55184 RepID=A0AAV9A4J4_ACOGR|nr:AT-rich interactive domain-containing protein 3 [Acorus gramineus]